MQLLEQLYALKDRGVELIGIVADSERFADRVDLEANFPDEIKVVGPMVYDKGRRQATQRAENLFDHIVKYGPDDDMAKSLREAS